MKFGHLSCIQDIKDKEGVSSEEEHSEEAIKEVKKPRLVESSESQEGNSDEEILENRNKAEDKTGNSEELEEEKVGDNDHTNEFKEEDNILRVLLDMHGNVPLEDPGPSISIEGEEGFAGATQS